MTGESNKMNYKNDVFLSYSTDYPFGEWVNEMLYPLLETYLKNALFRDVKIFIDRQGISTGDSWPARLKKELALSRCLIAVWSPSYFISNWCMNECIVMLHREQALGHRTVQNPSGLIIPINIFDGEHFREFTEVIQCADFKKYARTGEGFKKTERFVEFQDTLCDFAYEVAAAIKNCPAWDPAWLGPKWLDEPIRNKQHVIERMTEIGKSCKLPVLA
ncbi:MAG: toll/interleukin-1 receptor domain-containing protein [Nitrospirae bacterium]|nr:toll/interleukin-1 receptor domain-containing protein [Nitrospirota bacterium]